VVLQLFPQLTSECVSGKIINPVLHFVEVIIKNSKQVVNVCILLAIYLLKTDLFLCVCALFLYSCTSFLIIVKYNPS